MLNFLGGTRGCAGALTRPSTRHLQPKNFEKTALRKRGGIFMIKMGGGHNYDNYCTVFTDQRAKEKDCILGTKVQSSCAESDWLLIYFWSVSVAAAEVSVCEL